MSTKERTCSECKQTCGEYTDADWFGMQEVCDACWFDQFEIKSTAYPEDDWREDR